MLRYRHRREEGRQRYRLVNYLKTTLARWDDPVMRKITGEGGGYHGGCMQEGRENARGSVRNLAEGQWRGEDAFIVSPLLAFRLIFRRNLELTRLPLSRAYGTRCARQPRVYAFIEYAAASHLPTRAVIRLR